MDIQWTHNMSWIQGNTIISMITCRAYSQHFIRRPPRLLISSFASTRTPRCCHVPSIPPWNLRPGFETQTRKPATDGFEAHTCPPPLDTCHRHPQSAGHQVLWASLDLYVLRLDSVNTVTPMYTCACRCPRCQPPQLVTRSPGLSIQASRSPFTALSPSTRHVSTWPSPRRRSPPPSSTPAQYSQETCHTHSFCHGRVSHHSTFFVDHVDNHSSQNESQGHISTLCSQWNKD
jgi:hypothetical protein